MTHRVGDALIQAFGEKIAACIGMSFEPHRRPELLRAVDELGLGKDEMEALLSRPWNQADIETLAMHLCVGETYFFRDPAAFDLLERELLLPLIAKRRTTTRHLRMWSAGCSTGEEAYSLAILISRLVPDPADWDITILGTDIHPGFLARAQQGIYRDWSFRGVPQSVRENYFDALNDRCFAVKPAQKRLTHFCHGNLMQSINPGMDASGEVDLILCRNVLMYFGQEQAREAVERMRSLLADDGLLLVAPTEAIAAHGLYEGFGELNFEGRVFHRKQPVGQSNAASASIPRSTLRRESRGACTQ